jgi:hypothetical protein
MHQSTPFEAKVLHLITWLIYTSSALCGYSLVYYTYKLIRFDTSDLDIMANAALGLVLMVFFFFIGTIVANNTHDKTIQPIKDDDQ